VRSTSPFPREKVPQLLTLIHATTVSPPIRMGQVILPDALGSGIDVIATRNLAAPG
jgi:CxxC motif-containing protein